MKSTGMVRKSIIDGFEIVIFACPKGFPVAGVFLFVFIQPFNTEKDSEGE